MKSKDETFFNLQGQEFYKETDRPVWPHRNHESLRPSDMEYPVMEDTYVRYLIERLGRLEKQTRPGGGLETSEGKDFAAFDALAIAGELVAHVAGWAIDHQIGLAAKGLRFVPLQPSGTKNHPEYLEGRSMVDNHEHERIGGQQHGSNDNPAFIRKCLANLVLLNSGGWPAWLCEEVSDAIETLEYGEAPPIFSPVKEGRKRNLKVRKLEREALAMVAFRCRAYQMTKEGARREVADALGVSPDTVKSWEVRLRGNSGFGKLAVDRHISFAENHASYVHDAREKKRLGQPCGDASYHEAGYGVAALNDLSRRYKTALSGAQ